LEEAETFYKKALSRHKDQASQIKEVLLLADEKIAFLHQKNKKRAGAVVVVPMFKG